MKRKELNEAKLLISQLKGYKHKYIEDKVSRLFDILNEEELDNLLDKENEPNKEWNIEDSLDIIGKNVDIILGKKESCLSKISHHDLIQSDLNHAIELLDLNKSETFNIARKTKENQKSRRKYKNDYELVQPIADAFVSIKLKSKIEKAKKNVEMKRNANKKYNVRHLKEYEDKFKALEKENENISIIKNAH